MILLKVIPENLWNEIGEVIRLFYPEQKLISPDSKEIEKNEIHAYIDQTIQKNDGNWIVNITCKSDKTSIDKSFTEKEYDAHDELVYKRYLKRFMKNCMFTVLEQYTDKMIPWGSLTGIRPTRIVYQMLEKGKDVDTIKNKLKNEFFLRDDKIDLLLDTVKNQKNIINSSKSNDISIYIGIPFCRTRCLYCSFTAYDIHKYQKYTEDYIDALIKEIKCCSDIIDENGYNIQSIYMGGGTPTSLNAEQLRKILYNLKKYLNYKNIEFTVEAGRPDTIDSEKLKVLKEYEVGRISINPQTMNNETLVLIGRKHTPEDIVNSYKMARDCGFAVINMDVIAGLPGETCSMFEHTLKEISSLSPENLTVHTLAIKRASILRQEIDKYRLPEQKEVEDMLQMSHMYVRNMRLHPYYLYRQKYMMGNLENVGYSVDGCESIYNIQIMEEAQNIIALGAGSISKIVYRQNNRIERVSNVKNVELYIQKIDNIIDQKRKAFLKHIDND